MTIDVGRQIVCHVTRVSLTYHSCVCARARVCVCLCDACACAQGVHTRWAAGQVCLIVRVQRSAFYDEPTKSDCSKYTRARPQLRSFAPQLCVHTCALARTHTHTHTYTHICPLQSVRVQVVVLEVLVHTQSWYIRVHSSASTRSAGTYVCTSLTHTECVTHDACRARQSKESSVLDPSCHAQTLNPKP